MTKKEDMESPDDLETMIVMRRRGESYRAIGEKVGISHEKARTILTNLDADMNLPTSAHDIGREKRRADVDELAEWLVTHGPISRDEITREFGYSSHEINALVKHGLPGYLVLASKRDHTEDTTDTEDVMESLRRAWSRVQEASPGITGLSHAIYDQVRNPETDLSAARITARYGWVDACKEAGVPPGMRRRSPSTYKERWTNEAILSAVSRYVTTCVSAGKRPTYLGFDRWQLTQPDAPSGSLVRMRMAKMGVRTWPDIVAQAQTPHPIGE